MFPRGKRLSRQQFPAFSAGKRLSSPHFSVFVPFEGSGYAVIIAKKTIKLSADRHRLKRRILSALRTIPSLPECLVVFPKKSADSVSYGEVRRELTELLSP